MQRIYGELNSCRAIDTTSDLTILCRKDVVKPALHGGYFLTPTTKQQLQYQSYLSVYGKDKVQVSKNMAAMLKEFHVCYLSIESYVILIILYRLL